MQANLTYRGTSYSQSQSQALQNHQQMEVSGIYRGVEMQIYTTVVAPVLKDSVHLTYRGVDYAHAFFSPLSPNLAT